MKQITEEQIRNAESAFYSKEHPITPAESSNWLEGAKWMQEQLKPEWVPVSERLPDVLQGCNFVIDMPDSTRHGKIYGGVYTGDPESEYRRNEFSTPGISWEASHWQPLPAPPEQ